MTTALGRWTADELLETARVEGGTGVDEGLPVEVRFKSGVVRVLRRRTENPQYGDDPPTTAVFLFTATPPRDHAAKFRRIPWLDSGSTAVAGRLWLVPEACVSGHYMDCSFEDDDLVRFITDELKLGSVPAVVYDPKGHPREARYYPQGLASLDMYQSVSLGDEDLSLETVFEIVEAVYRNSLITPSLQPSFARLWSNAAEGRPRKNAEAIVQMHLRIGLGAALPAYTIRAEQDMAEGRLDLEVELQNVVDRSAFIRPVLLELKVLRSFTEGGRRVSDKSNLTNIGSGVEQAATYRDRRGTRRAAVCCFDMRNTDLGDTCFRPVLKEAGRRSVVLRRWYVYRSALALRRAITAASV